MNSENNSNSLFNKLPVSILSKVFVLAQNPQLSLLNKNMHYASQQVDTISKYIVKYTLSNTETSLEYNISTILENYTRINMNETIGILVFRKIKKIDYEITLEMAIKYKWKNVLNKLLKMYVVIDRNTSTVVYKDTLFMNEGEYLDIDIGNMFSEENESQRDFTNIDISENLYVRPVITTHSILQKLLIKINREFEKEDVEALIDSWDSKIEIPTEFTGSVVTDVKFIDSKAIRCYMLSIVKRCCNLNSLELMKRILDLEININFSFQELKSYISYSDELESSIPTNFIKEYGYETKMELLIYLACSFYSINRDRKELTKYLEDNYADIKYQQILFDVVVYQNNVKIISDVVIYQNNLNLIKESFFKVESSSENIRKVASMEYIHDSLDIIRSLLDNSDKLKGELDENALKTAIKKKDYELAKDIITKYPNTASISCLEEAVKSGNTTLAKLLIESGVDLKSFEHKGIRAAIDSRDIEMLRLLLENDTFVVLAEKNDIERICSIKNYEMARRALETFDRGKENHHTCDKAATRARLKFNKMMLCLLGVLWSHNEQEKYYFHGYDFDYDHNYADTFYRDFDEFHVYMNLYEKMMDIINSKKKDIGNAIQIYLEHLPDAYDIRVIERVSYDKLIEIIEYVVENNLQTTFNDTEYDETNALEVENDIEVLNDRHYELAKSELVSRNFGMLKLLIEYGMNVNSHGNLILKTAYKAGGIGWIDYFISKGAKFDGELDGFEEACKSDKVEVLEHWIKNGGVVPKNPEYPCINMACLLGNFDMVKLLVDNGVELSDSKTNGVRVACRLGLRRTLKHLLDNKAEIKGVRHHQLEYACLTENLELVKMILEYYDRLGVIEKRDSTDTKDKEESQKSTFLINQNSDFFKEYKVTKTLLEKGEPIQNSDLFDGINAAVIVGNTVIMNLLLSYKMNLNSDSTILEFAVQSGNTEIVKLLLENGIDAKNNTRIVNMSLKTKNADIIRLLLRHGAKVYKYSGELNLFNLDDTETLQLMLTCCPEMCGDSYLLEHAIKKNKLEAVRLLLNDTCTFEKSWKNYVLQACENNNTDILKLLFEKGAKIKRGCESGVIQACKNNNLEMLKLLLERNPNLVLKRGYGLEEAIKHKNVEIIKLLIKYGADTSNHIGSIIELANGINDRELINTCQKMGSGN